MYYLCNTPEPVYQAPSNCKMFTDRQEAIDAAVRLAGGDSNGVTWYVHEVPMSVPVFKAEAVRTVNAEFLGGANVTPQAG